MALLLERLAALAAVPRTQEHQDGGGNASAGAGGENAAGAGDDAPAAAAAIGTTPSSWLEALNWDADSPLHVAAAAGAGGCVRALLAAGGDWAATNGVRQQDMELKVES